MLRRLAVTATAALFLTSLTSAALAHSGGLDRYGCHGGSQPYHCHNGGGSSGGGSTSPSPTYGTTATTAYSPPPTVRYVAPPTTVYVPPDYLPPDAPELGTPIVEGSQVRVGVTAERGSKVIARLGTTVISSLNATGAPQTMTFRVADGQHRLEFTATDGSGNESRAANLSVSVDGTPPAAPELEITPGSATTPETNIVVRGEPSADYVVTIAGQPDATGKLQSDGSSRIGLLLPDGHHEVTAVLRDAAGNSSRGTRAFDVAIPAPTTPDVRVTSKPGAKRVTLVVTGPVRGGVLVTLGGEQAQEKRVDTNRGEVPVEFDAEDGSYRLSARAIDFQGRESAPTDAVAIDVDTRKPALVVDLDQQALRQRGVLAFAIRAEPGATIVASAGGKEWRWTADGEAADRSVDLGPGEYSLVVTATDAFGNRSTFTRPVKIEATLLETALGLLLLAAIAALLVWQRRRLWKILRWAPRKVRAARAERVRRRNYNQFETARAAATRDHEAALRDFAAATREWERRKEELNRHIGLTESFRGRESDVAGGVSLQRGERLLFSVAADLLEIRRPNGHDVLTRIDYGRALITNERVLLVGHEGNKEWSFKKYVSHRHSPTLTTIAVSNRQRHSSIGYQDADAADVRYFLDLALADFRGSRAHLTSRLRDELAAHLLAEPAPPIEPAIIEEPNPFEHHDAAANPEAEPGRWAPDPSGRFVQRWWDGQSWTEHVTDTHGSVHSDALEPAGIDTPI